MAAEDPTPEQWRDIPGYEGYYEVSSIGRVRSASRFRGDGRRKPGKIIKTPLSMGYPCFNLCRDGEQIQVRVHRMVALAFLGPAPDDSETVNHKDFDRLNNRSENLEWLSHADNIRHAHASARCASARVYGRGDTYKRISPETVLGVRQGFSNGISTGQLARSFGMSRTNVYRIVHRQIWKNL